MRTLVWIVGLLGLVGCGAGELTEDEKRDFELELSRLYGDAGASDEGALDQ